MKLLIATLLAIGISLLPLINQEHADNSEIVLEPAVAVAAEPKPSEPEKPATKPEKKPEKQLTEQEQRNKLIRENPKKCDESTQLILWPDGTCKDKAASQQVAQAPTQPTSSVVPSNPTGNKAMAKDMAAAKGWTGSQWTCLHDLWVKESNFRTEAYNSSSGATGIPQSLPGSKMASHGADWRTNPRTQIAWGLDYIGGRYGTPCAAWQHSVAVNWY
tara:strand:+ start:78 stop:728 length:651 start_codon:yes stop_codon:yes gene_type:complete